MKQIFMLMTLLLCIFSLSGAYAITILECVDAAGNSSFQDHCPPGTTPASSRDIRTGTQETGKTTSAKKPAEAAATGDATIIFYTTSTDCDACMVYKGVLDMYGANYTAKDISTDLAVRQELKDKSGGTGTSVSVPTVIMNDQVISGFSKEALVKALEGAGYRKPGAETAATAAPEKEAGAEAEIETDTETDLELEPESELPVETESLE